MMMNPSTHHRANAGTLMLSLLVVSFFSACVFGFDTTLPVNAGSADSGDGGGLTDVNDGDAVDGDLSEVTDATADSDVGLPDADLTDLDSDVVEFDSDSSDEETGGPDGDTVDDLQDTTDAADVVEPDVAEDTVEPDGLADTDADLVPDVGTDTTPTVRCAELDCAAEGRQCDEAVGDVDASCGDCLTGFIVDGELCRAPECRGEEDCSPNPAEVEWSECGGYADTCATEGTRTRLVYSGSCVSGRCEVTSTESAEPCPEPRVTDGDPCQLGVIPGLCVDEVCTIAPPAPTNVSASDGTSAASVRVTWSSVAGATGYNVYREDLLLTPEPVTALVFDDTGLTAGGVPAAVMGVETVGATSQITVTWSEVAGIGPSGPSAEYRVAAVNAAGEGAPSESDPGFRQGLPLVGYEVSVDGSGGWISVGTATNFRDTDAPAGTLVVENVQASDGDSDEHVTLSAEVRTEPGVVRSYQVRAVNAAGASAASAERTGQRTVGTPSLRWQRSSGGTPTDFSNIIGGTSTPFNDTDAPADGSFRYYRAVVSALGAVSVTSDSDSGFRRYTGPAPGTLGGACRSDGECPTGTWCSDVNALERCSPRVFTDEVFQMDFVYVPAGTFLQGVPGAVNQERPYLATLTRSFFVSRTEVTQAQWRAATGGPNPSCYQSLSETTCSTEDSNDNGPVENVDWYAALGYANRLSAQSGLDECYELQGCADNEGGWLDGTHTGCTSATFVGQDCNGYRLLTESEWERAARGGTTTTFYWGAASDSVTAGLYAWFNGVSSRTQAVGQKLPNPYGLFDMGGNVSEWVWDWAYQTTVWSSYPEESATDFTGPATGSGRGIRGGAYVFGVTPLGSGARSNFPPTTPRQFIGFRLARTVQ